LFTTSTNIDRFQKFVYRRTQTNRQQSKTDVLVNDNFYKIN